jgi:hypothetical protein
MFNNLLNDGIDGSLSSKRVITFLAFLLCAIAFISNLFWGFEIKQFMYESMIYLTMVGLGVTIAEKFSPLNKKTDFKKDAP